jgi:hypothetical protein
MRRLLDRLDPVFAAAAIAIAGLTVYSQVPYQLVPINLPQLPLAEITRPSTPDL